MGGVKINASIRRKYYSLEEILLLEENQPREMIRKCKTDKINRQRKANGEAKKKEMLEDITSKNYTQFSHAIMRASLVTENSTINFAKLQFSDIRSII